MLDSFRYLELLEANELQTSQDKRVEDLSMLLTNLLSRVLVDGYCSTILLARTNPLYTITDLLVLTLKIFKE